MLKLIDEHGEVLYIIKDDSTRPERVVKKLKELEEENERRSTETDSDVEEESRESGSDEM